MIVKKLDDVNESDLKSLIDNCVQEGKTIEYKASLNLKNNSDKKEFLADVSSFANASGGDLIFGISEEKGLPTEIEGIAIDNVDLEIQRIESIIRSGIEPRLPSLPSKNIHFVPLSNNHHAIIIRICKSWISPHRVVFKGHDKFYTRSSGGKYPMDVSELRIAFNLTDTILDKIQKFRENRISNIIANETPLPMKEGAKIVLHLIPLISFSPGQRFEIEKNKDYVYKYLMPFYQGAWDYRYNFDGFITFFRNSAYSQLFRNGIIEAIDTGMLNYSGVPLIPSVFYESTIIKTVSTYIDLFKLLGIELPILVFLTFVGIKEYKLKVGDPFIDMDLEKIERDILAPQGVTLENYDESPSKVLKPIFDTVCNSGGLSGSLNYDENGDWNPKNDVAP